MNKLVSFSHRLPSLALLLSLTFTTLLTSCSARKSDGSLTIAGIVYLLVSIFAILSLIKQDWSIGKKIIWGLIIFFFPFGGSIIYFLFSGRK
ncbi:PLD nuclease N-terminal domain-containing protein [Hymenobacter sp. BT175]|uniref:PLD nuclease N-terminal domain-containing protein n=1 Tax=Hymenobacter translucens TaxID=2886507 RepID=UPI001D0E61D8|nr:PLD nuclease N-terminal domain-containing protein [Hymenobacter translucens]MCC2545747.1 PLD nuclease N-terminal domain-containing protein [Hymenobacter translucens]